jgi:hypothetical protein
MQTLGEHARDHRVVVARNGRIPLTGRRRCRSQDAEHDGAGLPLMEGRLTGQHLVKNHAEREDVGARVLIFTERLLRREITQGTRRSTIAIRESGSHTPSARTRLTEVRKPEIQNLCLPLAGDDDCVGPQVEMQNAFGMGFGEAIGDLRGQFCRPSSIERTTTDHLRQRLTVDVLGDEIQLAVLVDDFVELRNMRVRQRLQGLRRGEQSRLRPLTSSDLSGHTFDRHRTAQACVAGSVDFAEPPLAEPIEKAILTDRAVHVTSVEDVMDEARRGWAGSGPDERPDRAPPAPHRLVRASTRCPVNRLPSKTECGRNPA